MPTTVYLMDNRPEAVSSAHWGDERRFASRASSAVSSTRWRDTISTISAAAFLKALLKLLATDALIQAVQKQDTQSSPGSLTLASIARTRSRRNETARAEIGM